MRDFTKQILDRIERLGRISEEPSRLTRTFGSPAMRQANGLAARWMREAGMVAREDVAGNLIGHYESPGAAAPNSGRAPRGTRPILVIGSHLDTVRDAGKFDGTLGVLLGIACVDRLNREEVPLPFAIEVVAFAGEEGVRFQSAYLGSRVAAGRLEEAELRRTDAQGISVAEAMVSLSRPKRRSAESQLAGSGIATSLAPGAVRPSPLARVLGGAHRARAGPGRARARAGRSDSDCRPDPLANPFFRQSRPRRGLSHGRAPRRSLWRGGTHPGRRNLGP